MNLDTIGGQVSVGPTLWRLWRIYDIDCKNLWFGSFFAPASTT